MSGTGIFADKELCYVIGKWEQDFGPIINMARQRLFIDIMPSTTLGPPQWDSVSERSLFLGKIGKEIHQT
jgi:hypothetical protein